MMRYSRECIKENNNIIECAYPLDMPTDTDTL